MILMKIVPNINDMTAVAVNCFLIFDGLLFL